MTATSISLVKKLLFLFLVFAGLFFAKPFLVPLAIGGLLATLFLPLCKWLESKRIVKGIAVLLCVLIFVLCFAGVLALLGWQISSLSDDFASTKQKLTEAWIQIQDYIFDHSGVSAEKQTQILNREELSLRDLVEMVVGSFMYVLTNLILVLAYIFLFLYYRTHLKRFVLKLAPPAQRDEMDNVIHSVSEVSQQYLVGLSKMIGCLWIMYGIGFSVLGIKNALFFAFLCGLLEIIPFIGNITGTFLTVSFAAVHGSGFPVLIGILGVYGTVQFIQGWVLEPLILGPQVKINPFATVIALVLGQLLWGIPGIFLAIPLVAMLKIICDHVDALKPYGFLIGALQIEDKGPDPVTKVRKKLLKN
jgi:predicted PurR-regulated permease PerM